VQTVFLMYDVIQAMSAVLIRRVLTDKLAWKVQRLTRVFLHWRFVGLTY